MAAFTLLELLIVVTVIVLMLVIGAPALSEYVQDKRLGAAQHQLQADLNLARAMAVNNGEFTVICPASPDLLCNDDGQWHGGWIVFLDRNGDHQRQDTESVIRQASGSRPLSIRSPQSRPQVRFSPAGTAPASNVSIVFCDQRGLVTGRKLVVSHSGRIRQAVPGSSDEVLCGERVS